MTLSLIGYFRPKAALTQLGTTHWFETQLEDQKAEDSLTYCINYTLCSGFHVWCLRTAQLPVDWMNTTFYSTKLKPFEPELAVVLLSML